MQEKNEISNNGWQNQGICQNFAFENIDPTYQVLFNLIVKLSFGYLKKTTDEITMDELAEMSRIGRRTIVRHIKYLSENNFIKIKKPSYSPLGGGSKPYMYSPCYPKGYGKIYIKDDTSSGSESKKQIEPWIEVKKVEYDRNENVDF